MLQFRVDRLALFTIVVLVFSFAVCATAAPVEIEFVLWGRPAELEFFNYAAALYNKQNPDVKVSIIANAQEQHYQVVDLRMAAGQAPDIFRVVVGQISRYIDAKQALDLRPYLSQEYVDRFFPLVRSFVERGEAFYAFPLNLDTNIMYYNKDYLENAGIKVPTKLEDAWTWYEYADIAAKVKAVNDIKYGAVSMCRGTWPTFMNTWGGNWYDPGIKGPDFSASTVLEGLEWQRKMYDEKIDCVDSAFDGATDGDQLFALGEVGMVVSGIWMNEWMDSQVGDTFGWSATFVPKGPAGHATTLGGCVNVVSVQSKHQKEAIDFAKWLSSDEMIEKFAQIGFLPPSMTVADTIHYEKFDDIMQVAMEHWANNPVELLFNQYVHPNFMAMRSAQKEIISLGMIGQISVEEALSRFEKRLEELANP